MRSREFFCNACQQSFSKKPTATDFEEGGTVCPYCGSENVDEHLTTFYPINSREIA